MTSICRPQWYLESLLPEYEEKIRRIAMTSAELRNRVVAHEKCMPVSRAQYHATSTPLRFPLSRHHLHCCHRSRLLELIQC
jgi:hypothetical protein